ncbi:MAG: GAF domain-containing protein [Fimbriimonadales bacterium]|nr:GAF domain-containing protein [Fimbriimonadales bacterium]
MDWVASVLQGASTGVGTEALTVLIRKVAELGAVWNALALKTGRGALYVVAHAPHERTPRIPAAVAAASSDAPRWIHAEGWAWLMTPLPVPELLYVLRVPPNEQHRPEWQIAAQLAVLLGQHEKFHREVDALKRLSKQRLTALGTLYETALASERGGLEQFLHLATRRAAQAMEAQACTLMLLDEASQTLSIVASYGLPEKLVAETCVPLGEGVAGRVALTGEPVLLTDLDSEPDMRHLPRRPEISGSICVPLRNHEGKVIGVLSIRRLHPAPPFTQEDLRLFTVFANQVASALENARLYQQLNRHVQHLSTLVELTQLVTAVLDVDSLLKTVARLIAETLGFSRCAIFLAGESSRVYLPRLVQGYRPEMFPKRGFRRGQGVIGMVAKMRLPLVVKNARHEVQPMRGFGRALGSDHYCALPIVVRGSCIGVVLADNQNEPFTTEQVELLSAFVNQAGIAIENARLYQEMERRYREIQSLAAFRNNILRSVSSGMFTVDEAGLITTWNRAAQQILGFTGRESVGRHYREVLGHSRCPLNERQCQEMQQAIEEVLRGAGARHLYKIAAHVGDTTRILNVSISPLLTRGRQTQGAVVLFEDITEYLNLESRLSEMERLATVGQMTATIAHEIRNPLTALRGAVDLMRQEGSLPDSVSLYVEVIQQEAERLTEIAEEFLEFAKPFQLQIRPTLLKPLLQRVLSVQEPYLKSAGIKTVLEAPDDLSAPIDAGRIEQAVRNLIQNAVHAMPEGGQITLRAADRGEWVTIAVQDTGCGVPPEIREKIFTPFYTTRTRGTGLGLSIVKKIVEGHGGRTTLECPPEGGSVFTLWLPKIQSAMRDSALRSG